MSAKDAIRINVAKAASVVLLMNILSRLLGFVRDAVIAREFGAGGATDAYMVAYTLPYALQAVLGVAFISVIVPVITSYLIRGEREEAWKSGSIILNWTIVILSALTVLGIIIAPWLVTVIAPGFTPEQKLLTTKLTRIIFPSIVFMGTGMLLTGFLNAGGVFGIPAFANGFVNIIIITSVLLLSQKYRIEGLAVGTLAGFIGFLLIQIPSLKKIGYRYFFSFNYSRPEVLRAGFNVVPVTLSVAVNQAYLATNRVFASGLEAGSITAIDFAYRLVALPLGVFIMAVITAIYPEFSRRAAEGNYEKLSKSLLKGLKMVALVAVPAAVGLIVLRYPLVKFVFERGAFDSHATKMTAEALFFFAAGLPAMGANLLITRAYYAMNNVKVPMVVGVLTVAFNVLLSFIFLPYLGHGGLTLANTLAVTAGAFILFILYRKSIPGFYTVQLYGQFFKICVASFFMGFAVKFINSFLLDFVAESFLGLAFKLTIGAFGGAAFYFLLVKMLKIEEITEIIQALKRRK